MGISSGPGALLQPSAATASASQRRGCLVATTFLLIAVALLGHVGEPLPIDDPPLGGRGGRLAGGVELDGTRQAHVLDLLSPAQPLEPLRELVPSDRRSPRVGDRGGVRAEAGPGRD